MKKYLIFMFLGLISLSFLNPVEAMEQPERDLKGASSSPVSKQQKMYVVSPEVNAKPL